ncbi:glycerophosphodiester phosphodiesterase [Alteromonas sp. D210916BOD_24]|uniref:glycerophosphodiester phosphodiesterase n=1 Tax=Alteromonas sp. D210916BOD_24 TaxID=3157618 RepID=UPI00399D4363
MLIYAHRGASKAAPENSIKAFTLAFQQDADGIEFDTYQHEGGIVVFHDRMLRRRARVEGYLLDTPWSSLFSLNIGEGEVIPTLAQAIATVPSDKYCNIEIKHLDDVDKWVLEVKSAVQNSALTAKQILVSSFNHHWLLDITKRWPEVNIGALTASYDLDCTASAKALGAYSINIALDAVNPQFVQTATDEGFKVYVYTVDEPRDMMMLAHWGVSGIFTNVPDIAIDVLGQDRLSRY